MRLLANSTTLHGAYCSVYESQTLWRRPSWSMFAKMATRFYGRDNLNEGAPRQGFSGHDVVSLGYVSTDGRNYPQRKDTSKRKAAEDNSDHLLRHSPTIQHRGQKNLGAVLLHLSCLSHRISWPSLRTWTNSAFAITFVIRKLNSTPHAASLSLPIASSRSLAVRFFFCPFTSLRTTSPGRNTMRSTPRYCGLTGNTAPPSASQYRCRASSAASPLRFR